MNILLNQKFQFFQPAIVEEMCRLGANEDGGYVIPAFILDECNSLLTLGLGENWTFENELFSKKRLNKVAIYDHTVGEGKFKKRILEAFLRRILFLPCKRGGIFKRIGILKSYRNFVATENLKHHRISISQQSIPNQSISFTDSFEEFTNLKPMVKIDIEGSEWAIFEQLISKTEEIQCLMMELHVDDDWTESHIETLKKLFGKMLLVHIHANNYSSLDSNGIPKALEITLINQRYQDRIQGLRNDLPLKNLDWPCNIHKEEYNLRFL